MAWKKMPVPSVENDPVDTGRNTPSPLWERAYQKNFHGK
jgi:hypothetical protein